MAQSVSAARRRNPPVAQSGRSMRRNLRAGRSTAQRRGANADAICGCKSGPLLNSDPSSAWCWVVDAHPISAAVKPRDLRIRRHCCPRNRVVRLANRTEAGDLAVHLVPHLAPVHLRARLDRDLDAAVHVGQLELASINQALTDGREPRASRPATSRGGRPSGPASTPGRAAPARAPRGRHHVRVGARTKSRTDREQPPRQSCLLACPSPSQVEWVENTWAVTFESRRPSIRSENYIGGCDKSGHSAAAPCPATIAPSEGVRRERLDTVTRSAHRSRRARVCRTAAEPCWLTYNV